MLGYMRLGGVWFGWVRVRVRDRVRIKGLLTAGGCDQGDLTTN